jgi:hypothetical protein
MIGAMDKNMARSVAIFFGAIPNHEGMIVDLRRYVVWASFLIF